MSDEGLRQSLAAMRARDVSPTALAVFEHYYRQLERVMSGDSDAAGGTIPEASIEPLTNVPELAAVDLTDAEAADALRQVAMIKLNGGLGTSMGLSGPKTALQVKDGLTFLDIIARQTLWLRRRYAVQLPLILMNSFRTQVESLELLAAYPDIAVEGLPLDFVQGAEPKLRVDDLTPSAHPADPSLEWCPPGHGDIFVALSDTGLLGELRGRGIRYAFLSNADNLGATCDPRIAAWLLREGIPYAAEVCDRTANDRKGGHLAIRKSDGRLVLRDSAMVAEGEDHYFQDNTRHRTFHTNNLWVDLDVLDRLLTERDGILGLPLIINRKTVDPTEATSTPVVQLETAMGTAIETIDGARAIQVPRSRFRPVKTTNELMLVQSDRFVLDEASELVPVCDKPDTFIDLDKKYFAMVPDYDARLPSGPPSLQECTSLRVSGDVHFGAGVIARGDVTVVGPTSVPDGALLAGA